MVKQNKAINLRVKRLILAYFNLIPDNKTKNFEYAKSIHMKYQNNLVDDSQIVIYKKDLSSNIAKLYKSVYNKEVSEVCILLQLNKIIEDDEYPLFIGNLKDIDYVVGKGIIKNNGLDSDKYVYIYDILKSDNIIDSKKIKDSIKSVNTIIDYYKNKINELEYNNNKKERELKINNVKCKLNNLKETKEIMEDLLKYSERTDKNE